MTNQFGKNAEAKPFANLFRPSPPQTTTGLGNKVERGCEATRYEAPDVPGSDVYVQMICDIDFLCQRIRRASSMRQALGDSSRLKATSAEIVDIMISCASTASLTGYLIGGGEWRLEIARPATPAGEMLEDYLDDLGEALIANIEDITVYIRSSRNKPQIKRCLALLCLALSVVPRDLMHNYVAIAGVRIGSNDTAGDAQSIAEDHEREDTLPLIDDLKASRRKQRSALEQLSLITDAPGRPPPKKQIIAIKSTSKHRSDREQYALL